MKIIIPHNIDEQKYNLGETQAHLYLSCPTSEYNLYKIAEEIKRKAKNTPECLILVDRNLKFKDGNAVNLIEMLRIIGVNNLIIFLTPVVNNEPGKLLDDNVNNLILSTKGIKLFSLYELKEHLDEGDDFGELCDTDHIRPFVKANFRLPEDERHSWANIWGIDRMKSAHNKLSVKEFKGTKKVEEIDKSLNYQRALYMYDISEDGGQWKEDIDPEELIDSDKYIPRILYIDDQADCGWADLFKHIIYGTGNTRKFEFVPCKEVTNYRKIHKMINSSFNPELILLDLRLENESGTYPNLDDLSGAKVLKEIKKEHPGLPVVITTASNKQWTYSELKRLGADACWTKEGIDTTASLNSRSDNEEYCIQNYLNFVKIIRHFQDNKDEYDLLRQLGELKKELGEELKKALEKKTLEKKRLEEELKKKCLERKMLEKDLEKKMLEKIRLEEKLKKKDSETKKREKKALEKDLEKKEWEKKTLEKDLEKKMLEEKRLEEELEKEKCGYWWGKSRNKWNYRSNYSHGLTYHYIGKGKEKYGKNPVDNTISRETIFSYLQDSSTQCTKISEVYKHVNSVFYLYYSYLQTRFGNKYEEIEETWHWFSWILQHLGKVLECIHCMDKIIEKIKSNIKGKDDEIFVTLPLSSVANARRDYKGSKLAEYRHSASHLVGAKNIEFKDFKKYIYAYIKYIQTSPVSPQRVPPQRVPRDKD